MKKDTNNQPGIFRRMPAPDVDLVTDIRTTMLVQSPRGGRFILWLTLLFFALALYWAAISEIEQVTRGGGKVIPSRQIQVVQNLEGGILSKLHANVGNIVEVGQLLLEIDKTRFSAPYLESRANYLALKAKIARLEAETDHSELVIPQEVMEEKPEIGSREEQLYNSRKRELRASLQILREKHTQQEQELKEMQARLKELNRTYRLLKQEITITTPLVAQGAVSEVDLLHLERQSSEMRGEITSTRLAIPRIRSKITEAQQAIEEEQLGFSNTAQRELNDAYAKIEGLTATSVALKDRLKRTEVRSPVRGTVNQLLVNTIGGIIQPGMDLMEIVPLEDTLLIEARIKPADIAFLRPDQKAMIKFTAYDFTIYGGLEARLEHISADSLTDEHGNAFYLVRLRTQRNYLGSDDDPLPIIPGMVASVDILTGKKTILSYLLKPVLRAQQTALRER
ncbi:HlyD family type I secretion periplasmic adaptor subunit [Desulfogranum mediterraneum]|uniref:HlyD family type I secretion periplasmic adaptor subunit n=1 Tax=Desulfogranum mediterraneum TaxID=160661 RepID=UPI000A04AF45|nr:HlyD family type I secretion periplasmic adaptor subunit [Desulfogranum mediterraneum]